MGPKDISDFGFFSFRLRKPDLCLVQHYICSGLHKSLVFIQSTLGELSRQQCWLKEVTFATLPNSVRYWLLAWPFTGFPYWSLETFRDLPTLLAFNNFARDYWWSCTTYEMNLSRSGKQRRCDLCWCDSNEDISEIKIDANVALG